MNLALCFRYFSLWDFFTKDSFLLVINVENLLNSPEMSLFKDHTAKQHIHKELQGNSTLVLYLLFISTLGVLEKRKSEAVVASQSFCNSVVDHLNSK